LELSSNLDGVVRTVEPIATKIVANGRVRRLLHGDVTGIPLHVIFTDSPFGAFFGAQFLDLFHDPGTRRAARLLVGLGLVTAIPTVVTGGRSGLCRTAVRAGSASSTRRRMPLGR
jgi:hypothetical protein